MSYHQLIWISTISIFYNINWSFSYGMKKSVQKQSWQNQNQLRMSRMNTFSLSLFFFFVFFSTALWSRLFFVLFTTRGTLNDIDPFNVCFLVWTHSKGRRRRKAPCCGTVATAEADAERLTCRTVATAGTCAEVRPAVLSSHYSSMTAVLGLDG